MLTKEDRAGMHIVAEAAVGAFPRVQVVPEHLVELLDALTAAEAKVARLDADNANLERERDTYRAALCDLVAATKNVDLGHGAIHYRHKAIDVLKSAAGTKVCQALGEGSET